MAEMLLTIEHNGVIFSPPVMEGVQIEWERSGAPGRLTFTTIKVSQNGMNFGEGDRVTFSYDGQLVFVGYVFTKKRDKEHHIEVTCYDQIRYLKNKYTYGFVNNTATQIITALCKDFGLQLGTMDNTRYVIPSLLEENISALDIIGNVLDETLMNTGDMFVLYDSAGKLYLKNTTNMVSDTLIFEETAANFEYTSSIDSETYNQVVLYYKGENEPVKLYTASHQKNIGDWGLLRYFEEVKTPTAAQNKANNLLKLYNRKTRELKVSDAFGDVNVRGGTLIPVRLNLGDIITNNYMLVDKVVHKFNDNEYTMDLTLGGAWE